jgi:hypothetical protein
MIQLMGYQMISVSNKVVDQVRTQVWNQVLKQTSTEVKNQVYTQVYTQVKNQVYTQVWTQVYTQVWDDTTNGLSDDVSKVWDQVMRQLSRL